MPSRVSGFELEKIGMLLSVIGWKGKNDCVTAEKIGRLMDDFCVRSQRNS